MLGALAVVVGIGALGAYMLDLHGHTCDRCGGRWRHFGAFNLGDEQSHTCSSCGEVQWWKCGVPHVLRGSEFAVSPSLSATTEALRAAAPVAPPVLTAPFSQEAFEQHAFAQPVPAMSAARTLAPSPPPAQAFAMMGRSLAPPRAMAAPHASTVALAIQSRRMPR
jgi:hypothetical protein